MVVVVVISFDDSDSSPFLSKLFCDFVALVATRRQKIVGNSLRCFKFSCERVCVNFVLTTLQRENVIWRVCVN